MDDDETVRWTVSVPKETDICVRTHLAQEGLKKGDLSKFVADAVRWRLLSLNMAESRAKNANTPSGEIEDAIEQALSEVRAKRFRKPV
jgi:hypothetical protein